MSSLGLVLYPIKYFFFQIMPLGHAVTECGGMRRIFAEHHRHIKSNTKQLAPAHATGA